MAAAGRKWILVIAGLAALAGGATRADDIALPPSQPPIESDGAAGPPELADDSAPSDGTIEVPGEGTTDTTTAAVAPEPGGPDPVASAADTSEASETADTSPSTDQRTAPPVGAEQKIVARPDVAGPSPVAPTPPAPPKKPVLVPGTGSLVKGVGDDFEDENWKWHYNHPKSSEEQDKRLRGPLGKSANGRWFEGPKRGTPDVVKRIALPTAGLEGSEYGLLISTLNAGIPGRITYQMHQDDLIYNMQRVTGQGIHTADSPSVVVRVYMPPLEQWEQRSGPSFGFRAGCYTHAIITGKDHPQKGRFGLEEYWPGMFVCLEKGGRQRDGTVTGDKVFLRIRGGKRGGEIRGPEVAQLGWWTLGLSFSPDGMVHYFAKPGVEDLSMDDHITSQHPYGYRTEWFKTFFFNVCSRDDGRTWSTPWVVDDPKVYFVKRPQVASPGRGRTNR